MEVKMMGLGLICIGLFLLFIVNITIIGFVFIIWEISIILNTIITTPKRRGMLAPYKGMLLRYIHILKPDSRNAFTG